MNQLTKQIKFEERLSLTVYLCSRGHRTIGYGRNLDVRPYFQGEKIPDKITEQMADAILEWDIKSVTNQLAASWYGVQLLHGARLDACIQMAFQMGVHGFMGFVDMRSALLRNEWQKAYSEALDSEWARIDSPARAKRVAGQFLTGEYYEPV